jgi:hypothetical protein
MDWSFTSGCSPPRLSATQLPSATDRPVFLSDRDFHPTVGAYSQAHFFNRFAVKSDGLRAKLLVSRNTDFSATKLRPKNLPLQVSNDANGGALRILDHGETSYFRNILRPQHDFAA